MTLEQAKGMNVIMINYIYDGSFDGLMTSIYEAYYRPDKPDNIIPDEDFQQSLFSNNIYINTDIEKSNKVQNAIVNKISYNALKNVFYVFLSELEGSSTLIYKYLKLGFKVGCNIDRHLSDDTVLNMHKIKHKVTFEAHRMKGLLRFRLLECNIYYSDICPDHNIIGLLAPYFAERFADQDFIIHDVRRKLSVVYNKKEWIMTDIPPLQHMISEKEDEIRFQNLWKQYFKSIAIKERINPRLQRHYMPRRYWDYLIEK